MKISLDNRTFIVKFDNAGAVRAIAERRLFNAGHPWECIGDVTYWHRSQPRPKRGRVATMLAMAEGSNVPPAQPPIDPNGVVRLNPALAESADRRDRADYEDCVLQPAITP
jgi:hypothetical protein